MAVSKERKAAMNYWGVIEHAVKQKVSTKELWDAIRESATKQKLEKRHPSLMAVNQLRADAAAIRNASDRLSVAPRDTALDSGHISVAPWAREQGERNLMPMLQIRFEHHTIVDGVLETNWRSYVHSGRLPRSVDELMRMVERAANQFAKDYEVEHAGIGDVSALSV